MSDRQNDLCQRCEKRPGGKWNGNGGFTWICGPCKLEISLSNGRGERLMEEISRTASAVLDEPIRVEFVSKPEDE